MLTRTRTRSTTATALGPAPRSGSVVATHPEEESNWLARGLVDRLCERSGRPVLHVVIGPDAVRVAA